MDRRIVFRRVGGDVGMADHSLHPQHPAVSLSGQIGQTAGLNGGWRVSVYLEAISLAAMAKLGGGNGSEVIRIALGEAVGLR